MCLTDSRLHDNLGIKMEEETLAGLFQSDLTSIGVR